MLESDPAWYEDLGSLARRPAEFWPARDQTPEERLNSLCRCVLYAGVAVAAYTRRPRWAAFALAMVVVLSLAYAGASRAAAGRALGQATGQAPGQATGQATASAARAGKTAPPPACARGVAGVRACSAQRPPGGKPACTASTPDNPFANMLLSDLASDPGRPPACPYDSQKDLIRANFNRGLVRNVYDIYERENSQRQFYTMPVTTSAPDSLAFAQFCYGNSGRPTCKEDPTRCTGSLP